MRMTCVHQGDFGLVLRDAENECLADDLITNLVAAFAILRVMEIREKRKEHNENC